MKHFSPVNLQFSQISAPLDLFYVNTGKKFCFPLFWIDFTKVFAYNRNRAEMDNSALMYSCSEVINMLNIVLVEPEIPQNCGNIARTCAATGARLHLIRPLGFDISDKAVKRAGLDYWHLVEVIDYENLDDFFARNDVQEMWCLSTKAPRCYTEATFHDGCYLFFGKETKGLPEDFLEAHRESCIRIPMRDCARSLNLSNSVAITVYEALRQLSFPQLTDHGKMKL
jgi:tRNA (cytidine/uridine-2'-O-)-methyltransferase